MKNDFQTQLSSLPKRKLPLLANLKLRSKLQWLILSNSLSSLFRPVLWKAVTASVVLFVVFTTSVSAYAYNSDQVTLGNPLYPIKNTLEKIQLSLARASSTEAVLHKKFAEKRLNEAKNLAKNETTKSNNDNNLRATLNQFNQEVVAADLSDDSDQKITKRYLPGLAGLAEEIPIDEQHLDIMENIAKTTNYIKHQDKAAFIEDYRVSELAPTTTSNQTTPNSPPPLNIATSSKNNKQNHQNFSDKIKKLERRVAAMEKQNDKSAAKQKNNTKKLINEINKQVRKAENSAKNNDLKEANAITKNTELIIDNANLFIGRDATDSPPVNSKIGDPETKIPVIINQGDKQKPTITNETITNPRETDSNTRTRETDSDSRRD